LSTASAAHSDRVSEYVDEIAKAIRTADEDLPAIIKALAPHPQLGADIENEEFLQLKLA
jgi:HD-GYP domain-containing protein (c-di-GMP phosphodiesterase class II)